MADAQISSSDSGHSPAKNDAALAHATRLTLRVCHVAGTAAFIDEAGLGPEGKDLRKAIRSRNTAALFDHLVAALSYQGISDEVAKNFMDRHGLASWHVIESALRIRPSCPKLKSYWHFYDCRYNKSRFTCAEPNRLVDCPLPRSWLRNGRLNQTAYSLYLFIRDIAGGDLVGWIDKRLNAASKQPEADRLARMRAALVEPLREVYGVSDKVLTMALSQVLLGAPQSRWRWREVGGSMIAVDTLVHNFLHRTGILQRFEAEHSYGPACYRPRGCAEIIETVAGEIDASQFDRRFPTTFPRFVQYAIWRYCSQQGLDICNGNQIDDRKPCENIQCALYPNCDFCHANDPHEEHDFGSFEAEGHTIFFKIDYLDRSLNYHSPDPADPAVTVRVITVMLADEY
jgi:hypothetical protein